jgi:hypothetical protein
MKERLRFYQQKFQSLPLFYQFLVASAFCVFLVFLSDLALNAFVFKSSQRTGFVPQFSPLLLPTVSPKPMATVFPFPSVSLAGSPSSSPKKEASEEQEELKQLIEEFEFLHINKNPLVLTLFTPPVTEEEKKEYNFWLGMDAAGPRLYSNVRTTYKVFDFKITSFRKENGPQYIVRVGEQRAGYSNVTGEYGSAVWHDLIFKIVKQANSWLINKYDFCEDVPRELRKYGGFG